MLFLLYSRINDSNIRSSLGAPEYSYYFLVKEFMPLFARLGVTRIIENPATEADALFDACAARGEDCVLIAFAAPHNIPTGLRCPVIPLFAWEFERIPDEEWDSNPRNDWRGVLARCGRAITLSGHALGAVRASMGADYPVLAVPTPLFDRMSAARAMAGDDAARGSGILIDGALLSTRDYRVGVDAIHNLSPFSSFTFTVWNGSEQELDFRLHEPGVGALGGFYMAEPWGAWSRNAEVWVVLPWLLYGEVTVDITLRAYGKNQGRPLVVGLGDAFQVLRTGGGSATHSFSFSLARPARLLSIQGMNVQHSVEGSDERSLGIGLERIGVCRTAGGAKGVPMMLDFRAGSGDTGLLHGFWPADDWGSWCSALTPRILLPRPVSGRVAVEIALTGFGSNAHSPVTLHFGDAHCEFLLPGMIETVHFELHLVEPAQFLGFTGITLSPTGAEDDSRIIGIGVQSLSIREFGESPMSGPGLEQAQVQDSANLEGIVYTNISKPSDDRKNWQMLDFRAGSDDTGLLHGFWPADEWGSWCSVLTPWILLPRPVAGRVAVEIALTGFDRNAHSPLTLYLGAAHCEILVPGKIIDTVHFELDLAEPAQVLGFIGVTLSPTGAEGDSRIVGIGVQSLSIRQLCEPAMPCPVLAQGHVRHSAHLQGIVYTSVLNPCDDRKNWQLLVRAFVDAFFDCADATLVLKMTHHSQSSYLFDFHYLLQRMPPFVCNIVLMHGFLEDTEYARLIARTDFYVNVSKAEGLCIPLMEFMSCGKPVIAPRHTSLCDYLDDANSIRVEASTEPCIWPHDDRGVLRTLQYRVNEESLVQALRRGREMSLQDPGSAYRAMGLSAIETMRAYCGFDSVLGRVREFLDGDSPSDAVRNGDGVPVCRESRG